MTHRAFHRLACTFAATSVLMSACRPVQRPTTKPTTLPASRPATKPSTRPSPILDIRRGAGSFPLTPGAPLASASDLAASLANSYLARFIPVAPDSVIDVQGTWPKLTVLHINLSDARVRPDFRPGEFGKETATEQTLTVEHLAYVADPLRYENASATAILRADDATLDLVRDKNGARGLVLSGARQGTLVFRATARDFSNMSFAAPRAAKSSSTRPSRATTRAGGSGGGGINFANLTVVRSLFDFASPDPHTLNASLDFRARWLILPITLAFHGTVTASPDGSMTFSNLSATGYDPGGLLAAPWLNKTLSSINGHTQPILAFPDPAVHVTDVLFDTSDNALSVTINFARDPAATKSTTVPSR